VKEANVTSDGGTAEWIGIETIHFAPVAQSRRNGACETNIGDA
jgi:hypothetical protein